MARSAEQLHRKGVEFANQGRFADARRALLQAAALTDDPDLRGRITGTHAYALARTGELGTAIQMCTEALQDPSLSAHTTAILAGQMGSLAEQAGELDEAEHWLTRAVEGLDADAEARANLLVNRSLINMRRRALDKAAADASEATRIFAALELEVDQAQARHNEGYIALLGGDLVEANKAMLAARVTLAPLSPVNAAIGDLDRAEVLRDAGLTTEAESILRRTAAVFGAHRMPQARAETEFQLACSLLAHDLAEARVVARAAAKRFRAVGNETWALRSDAVRLRAELAVASDPPAARDSGSRRGRTRRHDSGDIEATASVLHSRGFVSDAAALRMAAVLVQSRAPGGASRAAIRVPRSASMEVRLLAHEARAARAAAAGRLAEARRHAASGLDLLAGWQGSFGSLDLQTAIAMHGGGLVYAGLGAAVRSGRPEVVFEWSERARHLSQQVVPLRPPPDADLAAELEELRMLRADDPAWLSNPRVVALRERARERQWSGTGTAAIEQRVSLDDVRDRLDADTAVIAYVFDGRRISALVVTSDRVVVVALPPWFEMRPLFAGLRADLDMAATIRGPMGERVRRSLDDRLAALSAALLDDPIRAAGARRRVVLTVPGVLGGVPWEMLPAMRGRALTLATSATRWLHTSERTGPARAMRIGFAAGPRVARAADELGAAAAEWPASAVRERTHATVRTVGELAGAVDVLHIAAHGRHSAENPMFSGLELADGTLFGYDIDLIEKVPDTVILSACEVGRSSVRWGEEAVGMTRIWLHAGTRAVVAAPVVVADDDACELLAAMHQGLAAGEPPSEALAAASDRTGIVAPFQVHGAGF